jgi:hypothetical protein
VYILASQGEQEDHPLGVILYDPPLYPVAMDDHEDACAIGAG